MRSRAFDLSTPVADAAFFAGSTPDVARRLIGALLVHESKHGTCIGRIVETEAYLSAGDPASHSWAGETARNRSMFLSAGHAYLYRIYGIHVCFNVVTEAPGQGAAVLIRALEPLVGLSVMAERRGVLWTEAESEQAARAARTLCSGPGKLVQALGLGMEHDGTQLAGGPVRIHLPDAGFRPGRLRFGPRIGISRAKSKRLRFHPHASPWTSRGSG